MITTILSSTVYTTLCIVIVFVGIIAVCAMAAKTWGQVFGLLFLLILTLGVGLWLYGQTPAGKNIAEILATARRTQGERLTMEAQNERLTMEAQNERPTMEAQDKYFTMEAQNERLTMEAFTILNKQYPDYDDARRSFIAALKQDSSSSQTWEGYSDCLWKIYCEQYGEHDLNDLAESIRACRRSIELDPDVARTHVKLAERLVESTEECYTPTNYSEAKEHCQRALELEPHGQFAEEASEILDEIIRKEGN